MMHMAKKVLVVDDEQSVRDFFQLMLPAEGLGVLLASNGAEALLKARNECPDLILLDWMMPLMDGLTTLKMLKSNEMTCHIPVVMLTAKTQTHDFTEASVEGADAYITKPFEAEDVLALMRRFFEAEDEQR
jgi:CheY-like chemotaxis protein